MQASLPKYYNRKENKLSDHRPVLAIFKLQTIKIDREKKDELRSKILETMAGKEQISKLSILKASINSGITT